MELAIAFLIMALLTLLLLYRRRWRKTLKTLANSRTALLRLYSNYDETSRMLTEEREGSTPKESGQ